MKKYKFSFTGRQTGAIGIFYPITETYEAKSEAEAVNMLMTDYEHISALTLNGNSFKIEDKHFKHEERAKTIQPVGTKCIVNTGGNDTPGEVKTPKINVHGHYWKEQDSYCIRFANGTSQYIPAKYIKFV